MTNFDKVYLRIEPRLNKLGFIKTNDAWLLCKDFNYSVVCREFKFIMETMIEQGKAIKVGIGMYIIERPNKK